MHISRALVAAAFLAAGTVGSAHAADKKVIAKVNGVEITQDDLTSAEAAFGSSIASTPEKQRRLQLVRHLINTQLLATAAEKAKLDGDASLEAKKKYYARRALGDLFWTNKIKTAVTVADAQSAYDDAKVELTARHILLKKEEDAVDMIERLNRGEDFAELAKEHSVGPTGKQGGQLPPFTKSQMVKEFSEAAFALKAGDLSEPVKTQFGWHVIKVEKRRDVELPPFDQVKEQILANLYQNKFQEILGGLLQNGKIEIVDESVKKDMQEEAARGSFGAQRGSGQQ